MKVTAFDADSKENGEIQYHKINGGSEFIDSVEVDMNNGNVFLVSDKGLDRETTESKYRNDYSKASRYAASRSADLGDTRF